MKRTLAQRGAWALIALCASVTICGATTHASSIYSETPDEDPPYSGPVVFPMEKEPAAIRNAPAYDVADAKRYVDDMPKIRALVDSVQEGSELVAFGERTPSEDALNRLSQEIQSLSAGNHKVSLLMVDLKTQSGVVYNARVPMCTQSTIKAIYIGSVLDDNPKALDENGAYMRDAVEFSANEPYETLREIYGVEPLLKWCREVGVDDGFTTLPYPRSYTVRDMFKMWTRLYCFLNSDSAPGNFPAYYASSKCSATKATLGKRFPIQTKAGWESGPYADPDYDNLKETTPNRFEDGDPTNDECAINDTGVVYSDCGPYLFVVFTDLPFPITSDEDEANPLRQLVESLYETQRSLHSDATTGRADSDVKGE